MDHNPDTINRLIGAKVTSYRDLAPEKLKGAKPEEIKKLELNLKKDIHKNDSDYFSEEIKTDAKSIKPEVEVKKIKLTPVEDTQKEFKNRLGDLNFKLDKHKNDESYKADAEELPEDVKTRNKKKRQEDAFSFLMDTSEEDSFDGTDKSTTANTPISDMDRVNRGMAKLMGGAPKKRWYKPGFVRRAQAKRHYDATRKDLVLGVGSQLAESKGIDGNKAKRILNEVDTHGARLSRAGYKKAKAYLKNR